MINYYDLRRGASASLACGITVDQSSSYTRERERESFLKSYLFTNITVVTLSELNYHNMLCIMYVPELLYHRMLLYHKS